MGVIATSESSRKITRILCTGASSKCPNALGRVPCRETVECPSGWKLNGTVNPLLHTLDDLGSSLTWRESFRAAHSSRLVTPIYSCSDLTTGTIAIAARAYASCRYGPCWVD